MLTLKAMLALSALSSVLTAGLGDVNFDSASPGSAPPNWSIGTGDSWVVRADSSAPSRKNVLESSGSSGESPVALFTPVICRDGEVSVKFRIEPGGASGTAGVVWRYRDPKNYYLLDFNPGRKSISLFKVRDGVRVAIPETRSVAGRDQHDIRPGEWHAAKVIFRGNHIRVFFGNRRLFEAIDSGAASSGRAGVVTSGSTVVAFDDFRIDKKG